MKKIVLGGLLIFVIFLGIASMSFAEGDKIGFKGIMLGMSHDDLILVLESDENWFYSGIGSLKNITDNEVLNIYLKKISESSYIELGTKYNIGSEGEGETQYDFKIAQVFITFFENKISEIELRSVHPSADQFDTTIKDWAKFALKGLNKKYGKSKKISDINVLGILDIKPGYDRILSKWTKKDKIILLMLGAEEFNYYAMIQFVDKKVEAKQAKQKEIKSSEF